MSLPSDRQTVPVEPELHPRGDDQHGDACCARLDAVGPVHHRRRGVPEHHATRHEDTECDEQRDERFDPLVAVGVLEVRRPGGEVQSREHDQAVGGVGEAVDRLRPDREAAGDPPDAPFGGHEAEVGGEHDRAHAADGASPVVAHCSHLPARRLRCFGPPGD